MERLLADTPPEKGTELPSSVQRQRMNELLADYEKTANSNRVAQDVHKNLEGMLDRWGDDLYHCYDIEGLPRSNLGMEALFGDARRHQRQLNGQADTSNLDITGQVSLRVSSAGQETLMEMVSQVPTWVYRTASRCLEAVETGIKWARLLHRNAAKALETFKAQADELRQQADLVPKIA